MRRTRNKLTARGIASMIAGVKAVHSDGGGLYLIVDGEGRARWEYRPTVAGKVRFMGLGACEAVTLAAAREERDRWEAVVRQGLDPIAERQAIKRKAAAKTFEDVAKEVIDKRCAKSKSDITKRSYKTTLSSNYLPAAFLSRPVDQIMRQDVIAAIKPIWARTPVTAKRIASRIEAILDYASVHGWRPEGMENAARWKNCLGIVFEAATVAEQHHAALPYKDAPAFMSRLATIDTVSSMALQFLILTAVRCGEALGATWAEVDLDAGLWTIPASRMKSTIEHVVPLSPAAQAILCHVKPLRRPADDFVFPGKAAKRPLSRTSLRKVADKAGGEAVTIHGFRSTFRDWCGDETSFPREVAEAALAHVIGNAAEAAYRRGSAIEKRKALMTAWASFCEGAPSDNVISLRA